MSTDNCMWTADVPTSVDAERDQICIKLLGRFLAERCQQEGEVQAQRIYNTYKSWCISRGEDFENTTVFGRALRIRGYDKQHRSGGVIVYTGLSLRDGLF